MPSSNYLRFFLLLLVFLTYTALLWSRHGRCAEFKMLKALRGRKWGGVSPPKLIVSSDSRSS